MLDRRDVLAGGVAAVPLALGLVPFPARAAGRPLVRRVIYDTRFAASRLYGRRAQGQGAAVRPISGAVTALWYDDLYHLWKAGPAAIAGMTTAEAFFCLETLGMDAGLRRALHAEHAPSAGDPALVSWVLAPPGRT
jgi:hypothetical protein